MTEFEQILREAISIETDTHQRFETERAEMRATLRSDNFVEDQLKIARANRRESIHNVLKGTWDTIKWASIGGGAAALADFLFVEINSFVIGTNAISASESPSVQDLLRNIAGAALAGAILNRIPAAGRFAKKAIKALMQKI